ncbi:MAG: DNA polymerase III subunit delta [Oscillospiraceae bacterium]|jgi:DNA polymerase-3 subunit delta|nr:DNA polymerase III subunit delta [Oscillospiraceae bacterium]
MNEVKAYDLSALLGRENNHSAYLVYGNESFLVKRSLEEIYSRYSPEFPDMDLVHMDGSVCVVNDILENTVMLPQFSSVGVLSICDFNASARGQGDVDKLCEAVESADGRCIIVLWLLNAEAPFGEKKKADKKWTKLANSVSKNGVCVNCSTPTESYVTDILCSFAKERGAVLSKRDAGKLIKTSGLNVTALIGELEKLILLSPDKVVTGELIEQMSEVSIETNIFNLAKNLLWGNYDGAYDVLEKLYLQREEPDRILMILQDAFVDLYRAKAARAANVGAGEMQSVYGGSYAGGKKFRAENALRDCTKYSAATIREYLDAVFDTAVKLRSSKANKNIILEKLIARICEINGHRQ